MYTLMLLSFLVCIENYSIKSWSSFKFMQTYLLSIMPQFFAYEKIWLYVMRKQCWMMKLYSSILWIYLLQTMLESEKCIGHCQISMLELLCGNLNHLSKSYFKNFLIISYLYTLFSNWLVWEFLCRFNATWANVNKLVQKVSSDLLENQHTDHLECA